MPAYFCTKTGARIVAPGVSKAVDPVNGHEECTADDDEHVKTKKELREDAAAELAADKKEAAAEKKEAAAEAAAEKKEAAAEKAAEKAAFAADHPGAHKSHK